MVFPQVAEPLAPTCSLVDVTPPLDSVSQPSDVPLHRTHLNLRLLLFSRRQLTLWELSWQVECVVRKTMSH